MKNALSIIMKYLKRLKNDVNYLIISAYNIRKYQNMMLF